MLTITIDQSAGDGWQVTFNLTMNPVSGKHSFAVRPAADLILALTDGNAIQVRAGASVLGPTSRPASTEPTAAALILPQLVVVLDDVQRIYRTAFLIPDEVTHRELRELEMIRELKTAGSSRWPYPGIDLFLLPERLAEFLERTDAHEGAILARLDNIRMTVAGHDFDLGPVQLHCPHMILSNIEELRAAGTHGDPEAKMRCGPGEHLTISSLTVNVD